MPPMKTTGNREQGTGNSEQGTANNGAELVTTIAPARALEKQIPPLRYGMTDGSGRMTNGSGSGIEATLTLAEVRKKLDGKTGKRFWKNLDELAETPGFHEMLEQIGRAHV